jgi:hypothetical protein
MPGPTGTHLSVSKLYPENYQVRMVSNSAGIMTASTYDNATGTRWKLDSAESVLAVGVWAHIAVTQDGVSPVLYINGVAPAQTFSVSIDKSYWIANIPADLASIGRLATAGVNIDSIDAVMKDVMMHNRALSANEIMQLYRLSISGRTKPRRLWQVSSNFVSVTGDSVGVANASGVGVTLQQTEGVSSGVGNALAISDVAVSAPVTGGSAGGSVAIAEAVNLSCVNGAAQSASNVSGFISKIIGIIGDAQSISTVSGISTFASDWHIDPEFTVYAIDPEFWT